VSRPGGNVLAVGVPHRRVTHGVHLPAGGHVAVVGGWFAVTHHRLLQLVAPGTRIPARTIRLPGAAGPAAFAVT
jgi:hypothetical protein